MANRLTDTTIWKKQRWFKKLSVVHKLVWKYLTDECNHAGIWKIDLSELLEDLGLDDFDFEAFLECCNKDFDKKTGKGVNRQRVMHFKEEYVWITGFMTFQYGGKTQKIKAKNYAVQSAIEILNSFMLYDIGIRMKYFEMEGADTPLKPLKAPAKEVKPHKKPVEGGKELVLDKDKVNTVTSNNTLTGEPKKTFNQKPTVSDFNGLPEDYIRQAIERVKMQKQADINRDTAVSLWEGFKIQKLTGEEYYANEGKVYSHFLDWLKFQIYDNGTGQSNTKLGPSAARSAHRKSGGY